MHAHDTQRPLPRSTDAIAVVGVCPAERRAHSRSLALQTRMTLVPAGQTAQGAGTIGRALSLNAMLPASAGLVVEYPAGTPGHEVVGELADPETGTTLREVVCVVDASHFWTDIWASDFVPVAQDRVIAVGAARLQSATGSGAAPTDPEAASALVGRSEVLVSQIEFASALVLVNAGGMTDEDRALLVGLLGHLNPQARVEVRGTGSGTTADAASEAAASRGADSPDPATASATDPVVRTAFTQEQTAPGWVALLNDEFAPRREHRGITALRYVQMHPFHPDRLWRCLTRMLTDDDAGRLVRSVGFCHVATRPHVTAQWDHVGGMLSLTPAQHDRALTAHEEPLAFGQDLALIGVGLDPEAVRAGLDDALLTDDELLAGPRTWAHYRDPLPTWAGDRG